MKKTYKLITTFIVLLSLVTLKMGAQISGVVTINSGAATAGTNYQTFSALATTLNAAGVSGPLTVNVVTATGPYTEQFSLNQITGMSATNTITINGNGNLLTYSGVAGNLHTLRLNGTDYLNINNLRVQGTGASAAIACLITNQSDYNNFTACTFSVNANITSSGVNPFALTSSGTGISCCGSPGNYNTATTCTMSGGYYGIYHYGLTSGQYTHHNSFLNCRITDFYYSAVYANYAKDLTVKGCQIDRLTRTTFGTTYLIYAQYAQGFLFDRNIIERLYQSNQTYTGTFYGLYFFGYYNPAGGTNPCVASNNIFRNIEYNGTMYGCYYAGYCDSKIIHNTFSFDYVGSTSGTVYGIMYSMGGNGMYPVVKNNIVSITRGGTGTKYGFYNGGQALNGAQLDNNDFYVNSAGGTNYIGFISSAATTQSQWQGQGGDPNGFVVNPNFTSIALGNLLPTNALINNTGAPLGIAHDNMNAPRSQATPDIGALEFLSVQCVGTPTGNSVVTPTYAICPGQNAQLNLGNFTSDLGVTYQWLTSVSSTVGPWTPISGATGVYYTTPNLNASTYYGVAVTCTNAVNGATVGGIVNVAGTTTNSVPYYENFDLIPKPNSLPNCSWAATNLGSGAYTYTSVLNQGRVPRSGSSFASFYYNPAGVNYFYTNGIQLNAGITYSASLWYITEYYGYNNWTDLSIMYGTTQSSVGLVTIATSNGPALSNVYKPLSNTFTVATSGLYYVAVRATGNTNSYAYYLSWDDLAIEIPCSLNSPTLTVASNNTVVCTNEQIALTASGADTYSWNTGATTNTISQLPIQTGLIPYTVSGTSSLTGCSISATQIILVNKAPNVLAYASSPSVCAGSPVNVNAIGATSYTWSNGVTAPLITVSPSVTTSYTVLGSSANGCSGMATQAVMVYALPTVAATSSQTNICVGETHILTATGASSFKWIASGTGVLYQGNSVNVSPVVTTEYTVTGTDAQGCTAKSSILLNVSECVGLTKTKLNSTLIYPNPTSGDLTLELNTTSEKNIQIMDVTGRIVYATTSSLEVINLNLNELSNGVYYVKIQSSTSTEVVKIVKQ